MTLSRVASTVALSWQAIEKVEAVTGMKLLHKYKLPEVQYKGVDGESR